MTGVTRGAMGIGTAIVLVLGAGRAVTPAGAQAPRAEDVLPALLAEVKGLRAAMEQMASSGAQAQLLVGRLQLQETRMSGMIRRLDTVRDSLANARRELERRKGALKMLEGGGEPGVPQEEMGAMLAGMKREVAADQGTVDRLAAEDAQLTQDLTVEQGRWVEINRRLDELERALAKR